MTPAEIDALTCTMKPYDLVRSAPLTARSHVETLTQMLLTHPHINAEEYSRHLTRMYAQKDLRIVAVNAKRVSQEELERAKAQQALSPALIRQVEAWHHSTCAAVDTMLGSIQASEAMLRGVDHVAVRYRLDELTRWMRLVKETQPCE